MSALSIRDLTIAFGRHDPVQVVSGISLDLSPGKIQGLAGESGSGKTVSAMAVLGLLPATAQVGGSIRLGTTELVGLRPRELNRVRGRRIAMVFQDPSASLHPQLTIGAQLTDHVRAHLRLNRRDARQRAIDLLTQVHVPDPAEALRRYPHQFSGGQRQRIAIARALAAQPDLLVADEPISALDASSQSEVASMMRRLVLQAGAGMLFISHDLSVVRIMADRVAVMYRGRIVESGPTAMVWADPVHPYTKALLGAIPHPDGKGVLPAAPAAEAPAEWHEELPGALDRG